VQRFRGGLIFKAHRLFVSLNFRLESNKEETHLDVMPLLDLGLHVGREGNPLMVLVFPQERRGRNLLLGNRKT